MADHDGLGTHRTQREARIEQAFTLFDAGGSSLNKISRSSESLRCYFKRHPRSRTGFVKQQHDAAAAEQRLRVFEVELLRAGQYGSNFLVAQGFYAEQRARVRHGGRN